MRCFLKHWPCRVVLLASLFTYPLATAGKSADAAEPLHREIDRLIAAAWGEEITPAPIAGDAEFMRRIYLDLVGRIPTAREAEEFLANDQPNKRAELIDRLLGSDEHPRRMQELFHVMLMERRGEHQEWTRFLRAAFAANMPWDEMAKTIVHPPADKEEKRGAAYFFTARLVSEGAMAPVDVPGLTRDVGRLLVGVDMQCAQCHDHLTIEQYKQQDFQGLHMIFENIKSRRDVQFPAIAEQLMTEPQEFMSVFEQIPRKTNPRVPGGKEIEIVTFEDGKEFAVPPDRKTRAPGVPKFSPLSKLAAGLASPENRLFARNMANRLWHAMLGRGLVEPLDLQHAANPPSHPELLKLLADEFVAHRFDIRWLLRELALSETYQRSSIVTAGDNGGTTLTPAAMSLETFAAGIEKRVSAEQFFWSVMVATGELDAVEKAKAEGAPPEPPAGQDKARSDQDEQQDDAGLRLPRTREETIVSDSEELTELREKFIEVFANPPKEPETEFAPTVKAALFLMHDADVLKLLDPRPGNLVQRVSQIEDDGQAVDALFLAILSRRPGDAERQEMAEHLQQHRKRRSEAIGQIAWALLASTEFAVNH